MKAGARAGIVSPIRKRYKDAAAAERSGAAVTAAPPTVAKDDLSDVLVQLNISKVELLPSCDIPVL